MAGIDKRAMGAKGQLSIEANKAKENGLCPDVSAQDAVEGREFYGYDYSGPT